MKLKNDGTVVLQKGRITGALPTNSEELRVKLKVMGIAWGFVRLKYPTRPLLADLSDKLWLDYVDWLLGEDVMGLTVNIDSDDVFFKPDCHTL